MRYNHTLSGAELKQWKRWAYQLAKENEVDASEVDWLLQGLTTLTSLALRLDLYQKETTISSRVSVQQLTEKWHQRIDKRIPVQYLTEETPWRNFSLSVSPDVLIPRPETELIINIAADLLASNPLIVHGNPKQQNEDHWADLGTGSGAIALGLAHQFPTATIHAIDISTDALKIAQHNATQNHLANNIRFYQGNWLTPLSKLKAKLTGIVSNPPYIPSQTVLTLQPEVTNHEPHLALDGGSDGLDCIKTLIANSPAYLHPGGLWLTELMQGQAPTVAQLLLEQGNYTHIHIHPDLAGIHRFVSARRTL
ncbi:MAG: peptide chain release factor N(5)-glutamine methyltransferase [Cyanobacteria bacterium J06649_4]